VNQIITLPANMVSIDGSASNDPDNNIISYTWAKISGPTSFSFVNSNTVQTQVTNLTQGDYEFELKVTDAGGLFSKDTIQVIVNNNQPIACNITQTLVGDLSIQRQIVQNYAAGSKLFFVGGKIGLGPPTSANVTSRIDIYNTVSNSWSITELSIARYGIGIVASGNKVFFAGGQLGDGSLSTRVDIFDLVSNTWTIAELSVPRASIKAEASGNKVVFAGGEETSGSSSQVDIFDQATNLWTTATLTYPLTNPYISIVLGNKIFFSTWDNLEIYDALNNSWTNMQLSPPRYWPSPVAIGNKIYFGGGETLPQVVSNVVDIYNGTTNSWSATTLSHAKYALSISSIAADNKIFWAGGVDSANELSGGCNADVEIYDVISSTHSFHPLLDCYSRSFLVNNKVVFLNTNVPMVDIYTIPDQTWSVCPVPKILEVPILVNNKIYGLYGSTVYSMDF
jgi:hypothetical protein